MGLKERIESITGIDDIFKKVRYRRYIRARVMFACYRSKVERLGVSEIAKEMGYDSHASVIWILKQFNEVNDSSEWKALINGKESLDVSSYLTTVKTEQLEDVIKRLEADLRGLKEYSALLIEADDLGLLDEANEKIRLIIKVSKKLKKC